MPWSCVGAQQGLGTVPGLMKCTCCGEDAPISGRLSWWRPRGGVAAGTYQCLHDGVIGGVHVGVEREGAFSVAVVSRVSLRRYDPVLISKATRMSAK